ncbi:MAG: PAS domain S-box protein, partial [archaeon]|nr:PAS domain S-box protein [archaeon]
FNNMIDGFAYHEIIVDDNGSPIDYKYIDINPKFTELTGLTREMVIGKRVIEALPGTESDPADWIGTYGKVALEGNPISFENYSEQIGKWFSINAYSPEKGFFVTIFKDITENKIAEEKLRKSEEKFSLAFMSSPTLFGISRLSDGRFIEVNDSFCNILKISRDEVIGKTSVDLNFLKTDDREKMKQKIFEDGKLQNYEMKLYDNTGSKITGIFSAEIIDFSGEKCLVMSVVDITARKRVEEALAAEKERLAVTLRSIGDGVITTDKNGKIVLMNKVAENLTGYNLNEAFNKPISKIFNLIDENSNKYIENPINKIIKSESIIRLPNSTVLVSKDGLKRIINDSGAPIRDKNSNIIGVVIVFRDVTEQRKIEHELINKERIESLGVLAGGIAHDFNNILMSVLGHLSILKLDIDKESASYTSIIEAESGALRARDLTKQLLTFAKGGDPIKNFAYIDEIIEESATFSLHGSNVNYELISPSDIWPVSVDRGQIGQVIQNLVLNAAQSMNNGGTILITVINELLSGENEFLLNPGKYIKIAVKDTGIGIPEEEFSKIFDPYYTTKTKGNGLGLSICHSIITKHGGTIFVDSQVGRGSIFQFFIPADPQAIVDDSLEIKSITSISKTRILVLEDDPNVNKVIGMMFNYLNIDYQITMDGLDTLEAYKESLNSNNPFDVVILDLTIQGGIGGKEIINDLVKMDSNVDAIVSSGYTTGEIMSNYLDYGFKGVLVKPYTISDLAESINNVMKKKWKNIINK